MGRGGGGHGDGLALQSLIVHGIVIAGAGVVHGADHGAAVLALDEAGHLLALQRGLQGQDLGGGLVALLHRQDVGIGGGGALDGQGIIHGIQAGVDGVVGVDDGIVGVLQHIGQTGGLGLYDLHAVGILHDVVLGGGDAGAVPQLDDAVFLQQQQGAGLVGGVVGNGDLQGGALGAAARQSQGQGQDQRQDQRGEPNGILFHDGYLLFMSKLVDWFSCMEHPMARGHIRSSSRVMRPGIRHMVFQLLSCSKKTAEGH